MRVPGWVGVKVTSTVQVAPGASVAQVFVVSAKSLPGLTLVPVTVTGRGNALLAVTVWGGLVLSITRRGNFRLAGENVRRLQAPALPAL